MFYRLYSWSKHVPFEDAPQWSAMLTLSFFPLLNVTTILAFISLATKLKFYFPLDTLPKGLLFIALYMVAWYFMFLHRERYRLIEEEFKHESVAAKRNGVIVAMTYILLSLAFFCGSMCLLGLRNQGAL
jgi:hypothetical protein